LKTHCSKLSGLLGHTHVGTVNKNLWFVDSPLGLADVRIRVRQDLSRVGRVMVLVMPS
jgi:hypothetical protein